MKLHASDSSRMAAAVTAYGDGYIEINRTRHEQSVLILPEGAVVPWGVSRFEELAPSHFARLAEPGLEVVVFGSGHRLRFAHPRLTAPLTARRIGVETMDLRAACRTYNILIAEGRKAAAALLID